MKIIYTPKLEEILVDDEDYNYLNGWKWCVGKWGYKGVSKTADPRYRSPWRMCTHEPNGRQIVLHFSTAEEAAQKYDELNENWFGDFALTNKKLGLV